MVYSVSSSSRSHRQSHVFWTTAWLWLCLSNVVSATALTYKLAPHEKACFFTSVNQAGVKMAFYFAVSTSCFLPVLGTLWSCAGERWVLTAEACVGFVSVLLWWFKANLNFLFILVLSYVENSIDDQECCHRSKPVVRSTLIIPWSDPRTKASWMGPRNDKGISSSRRRNPASIAAASTTSFRLLRRRWWTLNLPYARTILLTDRPAQSKKLPDKFPFQSGAGRKRGTRQDPFQARHDAGADVGARGVHL